jgi:ketosteroid isomerase-like protein
MISSRPGQGNASIPAVAVGKEQMEGAIMAGQHDVETSATIAAIDRFNEAFNAHDVEAVMAAMTDDCVFENTYPPPDGRRHEGQRAVRAAWEEFFQSSPTAAFEAEELIACGDRAVVRWVYRWTGADGTEGHVRGVDVMKVRDGKVAEKLAYVKG